MLAAHSAAPANAPAANPPAKAPEGTRNMADQPDPTFLDHLIATLAGTLPDGTAEERRRTALAALEALQPRDMIEAMLAARMIAAHHATMDGFRRAMQPEVGDAEAVRQRQRPLCADHRLIARSRARAG